MGASLLALTTPIYNWIFENRVSKNINLFYYVAI